MLLFYEFVTDILQYDLVYVLVYIYIYIFGKLAHKAVHIERKDRLDNTVNMLTSKKAAAIEELHRGQQCIHAVAV